MRRCRNSPVGKTGGAHVWRPHDYPSPLTSSVLVITNHSIGIPQYQDDARKIIRCVAACIDVYCVGGGGGAGGGGCNPKKTKKPVPNLEFAVAFGFFRYFSVFCGTFSVFFGLNFDKKFQPFKNHVNNEIWGGQELPNNTLNA